MCKAWDFISKCQINMNLFGRIGEMILSPNHMRNSHAGIIHNNSKVIYWASITTKKNKIINFLVFHFNIFIYHILKTSHPSLWNFHTKCIRKIDLKLFMNISFIQIPTALIVTIGSLLFFSLFTIKI